MYETLGSNLNTETKQSKTSGLEKQKSTLYVDYESQLHYIKSGKLQHSYMKVVCVLVSSWARVLCMLNMNSILSYIPTSPNCTLVSLRETMIILTYLQIQTYRENRREGYFLEPTSKIIWRCIQHINLKVYNIDLSYIKIIEIF